MDAIIHCKYDALIDPRDLKDYSKNPNKHGNDQIERLARVYEYQGIRHAIIVDPDRGVIAAGHGRKLAAIRAGITKFPVVYQRFESDEQFFAFVTSDNAIALWAELDFAAINDSLKDLGPDFDLDWLGIRNFTLDPFEASAERKDMPDYESNDENSFRRVIVHFNNEEDVQRFFQMIGQTCTDKTKSIWFPEQEKMDTEAKRYG